MKLRRTPAVDKALSALHVPLNGPVGEEWIEHTTAIELGKAAGVPLRSLLRGTEVYFPPKPAQPPKTKEYMELMERLRKENEEKEYRELVGLDDGADVIRVQDVTKEVNRQLTTVFNVLISIFSVAWAMWHWTQHWQLGSRVLGALAAAVVLAIAEAVLILGYSQRLEEQKRKVRKARALEDKLELAEKENGEKSANLGNLNSKSHSKSHSKLQSKPQSGLRKRKV